MPEISFPISTAPGVNPMESGGRLINAYAELLGPGARSKYIWRRTAGLRSRFTVAEGFRGALLVGSTLYVVAGEDVYTITKSGSTYTVTQLSGDAIGGEGRVTMDRNMNATAQVLIEHSAGMSQVNTGAGTVAGFSDADLPAINSLCYVGGYFLTTSGAGQINASGINAVTFGANDKATAEQSPDGLVRGIRYGRDLAAMGVKTTEFWGNVGNPTGFPFSFSSVMPYGLLTKHAVTGFELGWTGPVVFVAHDRTVMMMEGYGARKISTPDLDALLEAVSDTSDLTMSCYVAKGHRYVVLNSADWSWEYCFPDNGTPGGWHEKMSYGSDRWRADICINAFDEWLAFDETGDDVYLIDPTFRKEADDPLVWELRSSQIHAFPSRIEINRAAFDFLTAVGNDAGAPVEADPKVLISWSDNGGRSFGNELERRLGGTGEVTTVDVTRTGTTGPNGRQFRLRVSDPVDVGLMGGAWDGVVVE